MYPITREFRKILDRLETNCRKFAFGTPPWSDTWLLRFHPDKCHVLSFQREDAMANLNLRHAQYQLCGHLLDHVNEEKDLGVMMVDSQLTFTTHIDAKVAKAYSFLGLIRRNFQFLDMSTLRFALSSKPS